MPCFTVQTVSVEVGKMDVKILVDSLKGMGIYAQPRNGRVQWGANSYDSTTGKLQVVDLEGASVIKRAYSEQVVKSQAARFGWSVKKQPDGKLLVMKGKF